MLETKYKKASIKVSEIFSSFQGESLLAGTPSIWIRFFGCNLQCDGFGQECPTKPETYSLPYKEIDVSSIKKMEDLPVFERGCDSGYSWSKKFRHLCESYTVEEIVDEIVRIGVKDLGMASDEFVHQVTNQPVMLCFTGGEPMLQQDVIIDILEEIKTRSIKQPELITIETNGTIKLTEVFKEMMQKTKLHLACSPKLYTVSGERRGVDINNLLDYSNSASSMIFKFVVNGKEETWKELEDCVKQLSSTKRQFWIMPLGATVEQQNTIQDIVKEGLRRGYLIATRNHCYVFGNKLGT